MVQICIILTVLPIQNELIMINEKLLNPNSIVVVGASNNTSKPGGKIIKNLIDHGFKGDLYAVNPNESSHLTILRIYQRLIWLFWLFLRGRVWML